MGDLHDRAVEEMYQTLDYLINEYDREVFWDEVYTEQDYFEGQVDPRNVPDRDVKGKQVGEIDVLLVKELPAPEKNWMKYFEMKPASSGISYAEDQVERCEDFFGPRGWNVLTEIYTVPEWGRNWYDKERDVSISDLESSEQVSEHKYSADLGDPDIDSYISELEEKMMDEY